MSEKTVFKRKSVSLDADVAAALEMDAAKEGRSVSNLVNFRLRHLMQDGSKRPARRIRKGEPV